MLVDPATGRPIGNEASARTLGGQVGMDVLDGAGIDQEEMPLVYGLLSDLPSATTTTMWNMGRVGRTMTTRPRRLGASSRGLRSTFMPSNAFKLPSVSMVEPSDFGTKEARGYTPFNVLAKAANRTIGWASDSEVGKYRSAIGNRALNKIPEFIRPGTGEYAFSPGTLGRVNTLGRIHSARASKLPKIGGRVLDSLEQLNPVLNSASGASYSSGTFAAGNFGEAAAMSARGTVSQSMLSYINAAQVARTNGTIADATRFSSKVLNNSAASAEAKAAATRIQASAIRAFKHIEAGGAKAFGAKAASFAPAASRMLGTAGWILLAGDLIKMGARTMNAAAKTVLEAGNSVMGSSRKPAFGMGFRDNSVAATSRQRGVMAIASSHLNARSVLGAEASALHAHFG